MISGIYLIKNILNGTFYIGSSVNIQKRWICHLHQLRKNKHHCPRLQYSFSKYGEKHFVHGIIEFCEINKLQEREQHFLDNMMNHNCLNAFKQAYSVIGENHHMFGKTHTPEARLKIKKARAKQIISHSIETRIKIGSPGKTVSMDLIMKMVKARGGKSWNKGLKCPNKSKVILSNERIDSIVCRYLSGESIESIRKSEKLDWDKIKTTLKENNIETRNISQQKKYAKRNN